MYEVSPIVMTAFAIGLAIARLWLGFILHHCHQTGTTGMTQRSLSKSL